MSEEKAKKEVTYDTIKPGGSSANLPAQRYAAIVSGATLQEPTESGQSLRLTLEICDDEYEGTEVPTWFKFYKADGSINEFAIGLWKTTLARLGYEDVKEADLPELLDQIGEDRPGVVIKVDYQAVKGYTNPMQRVNIEGPCDNDVVAAYKDRHFA